MIYYITAITNWHHGLLALRIWYSVWQILNWFHIWSFSQKKLANCIYILKHGDDKIPTFYFTSTDVVFGEQLWPYPLLYLQLVVLFCVIYSHFLIFSPFTWEHIHKNFNNYVCVLYTTTIQVLHFSRCNKGSRQYNDTKTLTNAMPNYDKKCNVYCNVTYIYIYFSLYI